MKILQVSTTFKPSWETGGTVRVVYNISKELSSRGHEVTVFTTDRGNKRVNVPKNQLIKVDNMGVYYFSNISNFLAMKIKIVTPYFLPFIARKIVKNYDVIHIHEHRTLIAVIVKYYAKKYRIPYIVQSHGSVLPFFQKSLFKKIFDKLFGYAILNDASKVIALTETEKEQYIKMGVSEGKIEIVPNGINLSEYHPLPKKGSFRKKYGIKNDKKIILYLGRLHSTKGIDLLINAFSEVSKELNDVMLVIVGPDDGFLNSLKDLSTNLMLDNNVLFTGPIYNNEKIAAYVDADIFVTPRFSGFPLTFLESCACGTPVITTNNGDELSWIKNVGSVVKYEKNSLKDILVKILENDEILENLSEKCSNFVQLNFNLGKTVNILEKIYIAEIN